MRRYDGLVDEIKKIDVGKVNAWSEGYDVNLKIVEKQKVYIWIRLYVKEELSDLEKGDDVTIRYVPSGEEMTVKFIYYGKSLLTKDHQDEIVNFDLDDDKKILCLMVDQDLINFGTDIPFIRTMFKSGLHYQYQLVKRDELIFINNRTKENIDYYDCDW